MTVVAYSNDNSSQKVDAKDMLNTKAKRMTFEMDKELHAKLKSASAIEGVYIRDILTQATKEWLNKRGYL